MNRIVKNAVLGAAVAATTFSMMPMANAGERWRDHRRPHVEYRNNGGDLVAAGILGLAAGAIAAGVATSARPRYVERYPEPRYYRAPVVTERYYVERAPREVYYGGGLEPWSPVWYQYCVDRYRSFDPSSGTFMTYGGERRFCVAN